MKNLTIIYKSKVASTLYSAHFDGTIWYGNTKICNQAGNISPESNYNPGTAVSNITPDDQSDWMKGLPDSMLISAINIPGSHDAAAINKEIHTPYACHDLSISEQLERGIRLLDVRIKVYEDGSSYTFYTCHGTIGPDNAYQSLPSLLDECKVFLHTNPSELIIISLKIDDWNGTKNKDAAYDELALLLKKYPVETSTKIPNLGSVRGKLFLYNRMNDNLSFGTPISWDNNTPGSYANSSPNRDYRFYVQDQYEDLPYPPEKEKCKLVVNAFAKKQKGEVVWNFASATKGKLFGVYIMGNLLDYFGQNEAANRPTMFGWILFDYSFNLYNTDTYSTLNIVTIIIDSNFTSYPLRFKVIN